LCGGCSGIVSGAAEGEFFGGLTAVTNGKNVASGILVGGATGAVAGAVANAIPNSSGVIKYGYDEATGQQALVGQWKLAGLTIGRLLVTGAIQSGGVQAAEAYIKGVRSFQGLLGAFASGAEQGAAIDAGLLVLGAGLTLADQAYIRGSLPSVSADIQLQHVGDTWWSADSWNATWQGTADDYAAFSVYPKVNILQNIPILSFSSDVGFKGMWVGGIGLYNEANVSTNLKVGFDAIFSAH
jgi:hypothetical protein